VVLSRPGQETRTTLPGLSSKHSDLSNSQRRDKQTMEMLQGEVATDRRRVEIAVMATNVRETVGMAKGALCLPVRGAESKDSSISLPFRCSMEESPSIRYQSGVSLQYSHIYHLKRWDAGIFIVNVLISCIAFFCEQMNPHQMGYNSMEEMMAALLQQNMMMMQAMNGGGMGMGGGMMMGGPPPGRGYLPGPYMRGGGRGGGRAYPPGPGRGAPYGR
jgi:hypothetical protein